MPESPSDHVDESSTEAEPEFYYAVLNLPKTATDHEIRDRYRQLSMLFHPDRQRSKEIEATAVKRFLEIQKAYEILSDPITRQAYDLFGLEGVKLLSPRQAWEGLSPDEIKSELVRRRMETEQVRLQRYVDSKGQFTVTIAAVPKEEPETNRWYADVWNRVRNIRPVSFGMKHVLSVPVTERTRVILTGSSSLQNEGGDARSAIFGRGLQGTVRHQYSPRLNFQASTSMLNLRNMRLRSKYHDEDNEADIQIFFSPALVNAFYLQGHQLMYWVPPTTTTVSRRLFPGRNVWGRLTMSTLPLLPQFRFDLTSFYQFDLAREDDEDTEQHVESRLPSRTGLEAGIAFWDIGVELDGLLPALVGQLGLHFQESGIRVKTGLNLGLVTRKITLGAAWSGETAAGSNNIGVDVGVGTDGVVLNLDMTYFNQRFYLPIVIALDLDEKAAFWTTVIPTVVLVLSHHFILKPRRRKARIEFFRQARRELREAKSDIVRQAEETRLLLKETAQRHTDAETSVDGLVIADARYGPTETDDALEGLTIDVTVPLQALVSKSQLYIPGRRSKAGLQGFFDPVPSAPKSLRVRYTFRGRPHYAEIPDYMPVVLPLEGE
ncbi:hypothetical protein NM688_g2166 [Phlebia brevispora]|uniref:Uncharacterized protein n=1 Tax=Phlebia brevispora TaxID=194682 RepID=A0ACC1T991_9APHY|nr:hypothetical protein NM688_g2166 [Phlebia brevispora]